MERYSADEVAKILLSEGCGGVNKRTINYYAFEKKMFDIQDTGKKCFTENEINKIRAIRLLRECTNMSLEQIKEVIGKCSLEEVKKICISRTFSGYCRTDGLSQQTNSSNSLMNASKVQEAYSMPYARVYVPEVKPSPAPDTQRTLKVNEDITLTVSSKVDTERLKKIIEFIKGL